MPILIQFPRHVNLILKVLADIRKREHQQSDDTGLTNQQRRFLVETTHESLVGEVEESESWEHIRALNLRPTLFLKHIFRNKIKLWYNTTGSRLETSDCMIGTYVENFWLGNFLAT